MIYYKVSALKLFSPVLGGNCYPIGPILERCQSVTELVILMSCSL
jgi:hypothetical protein